MKAVPARTGTAFCARCVPGRTTPGRARPTCVELALLPSLHCPVGFELEVGQEKHAAQLAEHVQPVNSRQIVGKLGRCPDNRTARPIRLGRLGRLSVRCPGFGCGYAPTQCFGRFDSGIQRSASLRGLWVFTCGYRPGLPGCVVSGTACRISTRLGRGGCRELTAGQLGAPGLEHWCRGLTVPGSSNCPGRRQEPRNKRVRECVPGSPRGSVLAFRQVRAPGDHT